MNSVKVIIFQIIDCTFNLDAGHRMDYFNEVVRFGMWKTLNILTFAPKQTRYCFLKDKY